MVGTSHGSAPRSRKQGGRRLGLTLGARHENALAKERAALKPAQLGIRDSERDDEPLYPEATGLERGAPRRRNDDSLSRSSSASDQRNRRIGRFALDNTGDIPLTGPRRSPDNACERGSGLLRRDSGDDFVRYAGFFDRAHLGHHAGVLERIPIDGPHDPLPLAREVDEPLHSVLAAVGHDDVRPRQPRRAASRAKLRIPRGRPHEHHQASVHRVSPQ